MPIEAQQILPIIASIAFASFIYFGIYILLHDIRSKLHRIFMCISCCFALWSFASIFIYQGGPPEKIEFWQRIGRIGAISYEVFIIYFTLVFTGLNKKIKNKPLIYLIISAIPILLLYKNISENAIMRDYPYGFWFIIGYTYSNVYNLASMILLLVWARSSKSNRIKKQARIIIIGGLTALFLCAAGNYIVSLYNIPSISSIVILIYAYFILYAIIKYRFMKLTPALVSENIISNIDELVILFDDNLKVLYINDYTCVLTNIESIENNSLDLQQILVATEKTLIAINNLKKKDPHSFSTKVLLKTGPVTTELIQAKFSTIVDQYNDIIGILMIGKRLKGLQHLQTEYKLTDRETEIIAYIIAGNTNNEIAQIISITLRTIKTHITNIYNKIGINNKIQLYNLLLEYDIITNKNVETDTSYSLIRHSG